VVITKLQLLRLNCQVSTEDCPEQSATNNEMLPVSLKVKAIGSNSLVLRKRLEKLLNLCCWLFERSTPDMDIIA
jgi:hypothetical protein